MTSLEMAGVSITLLHLDETRTHCLGKNWNNNIIYESNRGTKFNILVMCIYIHTSMPDTAHLSTTLTSIFCMNNRYPK